MSQSKPKVLPVSSSTLRLYRASLAGLQAPNIVGQEALAYALALFDREIKLEERCKRCGGFGQLADMYDEWDCPVCKGTGKIPSVPDKPADQPASQDSKP